MPRDGYRSAEPPAHGTATRYDHGGGGTSPCRCEMCREAKVEYHRSRRRRNAYGLSPWVDAGPARRHVRALKAPYHGSTAGLGYMRIAELAGISVGIVSALLYGVNGRPQSRRIHRDNAEALLAVTDDSRLRAPGATIEAAQSIRLTKCMVAYGIPKRHIGSETDSRRGGVRFGKMITVRRANALAALHWRFFRTEPEFRRQCECALPCEVEVWLEAAS